MARRPFGPAPPPLRAAARTTDRHRFSSWLAITGVTFFWAWSREAQATDAAAMRNARQDRRRITSAAVARKVPAPLHVFAWDSSGRAVRGLQKCGRPYKPEAARGLPGRRLVTRG